jgi:ribosomal protein S12
MNKRIVYQNDEGGISIIVPADSSLTIAEIAAKDVPTGKKYHIVDVSEVPTDRTFRGAWTWQ